MGAVDVPLKLTAYLADSRFGNVVDGAAPSVDAPNAEKGNNWTSPSPCRGMDNTSGIMRNGNWELARRSGNIVQETVNNGVATEPSTRVSTRSGMAHQRTHRGLILSIPSRSIRLITIVDGTNVVKSFVMRLGHGRVPDNTHLLHQGTLAGAELPRSRRRLAPTGMMFPSKSTWVLAGSVCAVKLFSAPTNQRSSTKAQ